MAGADWPIVLLVLLAGPVAGSFIGVLVDRLPAGRSLWEGSRCAACGVRLGLRDLVPVLSALASRRACRHCGAQIPGHLTRIELAATLAAVAAVLSAGAGAEAGALILNALVLWCLVALFYADLLHMRLPDPLTAALFALGLWAAWADPARGLAEALASGLGAAAVFWAIRAGYRRLRGREGLGLGDVKLAAGIGALLGWQAVPVVTLLAALLALAVAAVDWLRGQAPDPLRPLPFGSFLAAATALAVLI